MKSPLGRIVNTSASADGCVRVAEVKTTTGIFKRAITRLVPLFPYTTETTNIDQPSAKKAKD